MAAKTSFFFLQMALVLSLLITSTVATRSIGSLAAGAAEPTCATVYGVKTGDTCFSVTKGFKLSGTLFTGINPNLNCDKLFVGQWLCISGTPN